MGDRGPKPQPEAIAKMKGLYRPSRHKDHIAAEGKSLEWVHNVIPSPPEDLSEFAKKVWTTQLAEAQKVFGYIGFIDLLLFTEYCYLVGEMEFLKNETFGQRTYTDDNGVKRINPLWSELNKLRKDFMRISQEFGFGPSSRTRVKLEQSVEIEKKKDEYPNL